MKNIFSIILSIAALGLSGFATGYVLEHPNAIASYGATSNAGANALFEQSLAQPLGTTDPNMFVTSGADVQGNLLPLNSYQCLSVDTGQPNFEAICGTVIASATSGLTLNVTLRGLSTQTATTSNASFIFTHRRGADVRITDFPTLTVNNNQLNGFQSIPNPIFYSSNFTPSFWTSASSNTIATYGIVVSTAAAGCGNASETLSGCAQLATPTQLAAGTSAGSTAARLVAPSSAFNATQSATTLVPVTNSLGKLSQLFIDLTQAFTFSTTTQYFANVGTLTATTSARFPASINFNGVAYTYPPSQGAASSYWKNDGAGNLSWSPTQISTPTSGINLSINASNITVSTTTVATYVLPANTLSANKVFRIQVIWSNPAIQQCRVGINFGTGSATTSIGYLTVTPVLTGSTDTYIFATGASAERTQSIGYAAAPASVEFTSPSITLTNQSYLSFDTLADGSDACTLVGYSIQINSN